MKLKRSLLIILLAVIATMLLQVNVKAEDIDYSGYFYLLTDEGIATQLVPGVEIIAGIKGEYTGEITADVTNKKITINNFTAEELKIFDTEYDLWIEGVNTVNTISDDDVFYAIIAYGNGKITTGSSIISKFYGSGQWSYSEETGESSCTYYIGDSIDNSVEDITIDLDSEDLDAQGKILDEVAQKICNLLKLDGEIYYWMDVNNYPIIPASIFTALKESNHSLSICDEKWSIVFNFDGNYITNPDSDFKIGISTIPFPFEDMPDTNIDGAHYVNFLNTGSYPGQVDVWYVWGHGGADELPDPVSLYIYSFDEESKLYKYESTKQDPFETYNFSTDAPVGKYVLTHTILPDELVIGENAKEETTGGNQEGTGVEVPGDDNKEPEQKPTEDKKEEVKQEETKKEEVKKEDTTTATGKIPYAGGTTTVVITMLIITMLGIFAYMKNKELKGI